MASTHRTQSVESDLISDPSTEDRGSDEASAEGGGEEVVPGQGTEHTSIEEVMADMGGAQYLLLNRTVKFNSRKEWVHEMKPGRVAYWTTDGGVDGIQHGVIVTTEAGAIHCLKDILVGDLAKEGRPVKVSIKDVFHIVAGEETDEV